VRTSIDPVECPECGSEDVRLLNRDFELWVCEECGYHFSEQDDILDEMEPMRRHRYWEDD
jgi:ribosomal protein L37AE/L43A